MDKRVNQSSIPISEVVDEYCSARVRRDEFEACTQLEEARFLLNRGVWMNSYKEPMYIYDIPVVALLRIFLSFSLKTNILFKDEWLALIKETIKQKSKIVTMLVTRTSMATGVTRTIEINCTVEQMESYMNGVHLQHAFPHLSADDREFIHTGISPEEWEDVMKDEEEEE